MDLKKNSNIFLTNIPILYPLKIPENTKGFLVFLEGIKWEHRQKVV